MNLRDYLARRQQIVDRGLDRLVPPDSVAPATIHRAMRYSLFAGGKRIRPILCLEAARAADPSLATDDSVPDSLADCACSLELIHTYSLIHDDLPALDNDDYRRGKLTNHKVFGDAMAILAGDALLTLAFQVLAGLEISADRKTGLVAELSTASGTVGGMIGGQVADLEGEGKPPDPALLESIHRAKTGALLRASLRLGAIFAGASAAEYEALSCYGEHIGLAFQIVDDILDVEESSESLGKTAGKDAQQHKITFPAVYGLDASHRMAAEQCAHAHDVLSPFAARAVRLHELADLIVHRKS
ncbi:MAG TPA: farnesyl diphosphate synthase [Bryobacteraceae bacterium]|nr:farnesyl diphosphate synthase [Bryobacteraceae bacterium]